MLEEGAVAPDFTLPADGGGEVTLSSYQGKRVVLYFYPKDDTPGCTKEACEFTEGIESFEGLNAVVLGCSPDSPERHRKFIAKYDLKVTLLSDEKKSVMEKYGAWGEKKMYGKTVIGVIRSTAIIDPKGKIAWHWKTVRAAGHAEKVRQKLEELQAAG